MTVGELRECLRAYRADAEIRVYLGRTLIDDQALEHDHLAAREDGSLWIDARPDIDQVHA